MGQSVKLLAIVPSVCFGLGCWQLHRLRWKLNLIDSAHSSLLRDPVPFSSFSLPVGSSDAENLAVETYRKVQMTGEILPFNVFIGPRTKNSVLGSDPMSGGIFGEVMESGFIVLSPFRVFLHPEDSMDISRSSKTDSELKADSVTQEKTHSSTDTHLVLLHRGWISASNLPLLELPETPQTLETILLPPSPPSLTTLVAPKNDPSLNSWYSLIPVDLVSHFEGLISKVQSQNQSQNQAVQMEKFPSIRLWGTLDTPANRSSPAAKNLVLHPLEAKFKNDHISYAITWFGLCALSTWYTVSRFRRGRAVGSVDPFSRISKGI